MRFKLFLIQGPIVDKVSDKGLEKMEFKSPLCNKTHWITLDQSDSINIYHKVVLRSK